jgi:mono/diheme cytochrome c family protein
MQKLRLSLTVIALSGCSIDFKDAPGPQGLDPSATDVAYGQKPQPKTPEQIAAEAIAKADPKGPSIIGIPAVAYSAKAEDIAKGKELFATKGCVACHKFGSKLVGPNLTGITVRRQIEWISRMVLKPDVMIKEDPVAANLYKEYMVAMPNLAVNADSELPLILAYFKSEG